MSNYPIIKSTGDLGVSNGVKILVYGKAGAGKTRLCATAPNPLILSCEGGLLVLRKLQVAYTEIKTLNDLTGVYNWIKGSQEAAQFSTICLDSISDIIEVLLNEEKLKTRDPRKAYGEIASKGLTLFRDFRDLPQKHVLLIAKEEYAKDDQSGVMYFGPSFPGAKLGAQLPYFPDEVFQLCVFNNPQTKERVEALRCWPDAQNIAKDRSGCLSEWEAPNISAIITKIMQ